MSKSDYLEDKILDHVLRNTAYTPAATVYAALFTADPGETGASNEVSGGSYARQAVTFSAASGGVIASSADVTFDALPAATITHFGIFDASTGGNFLYGGALSSSVELISGSDVVFSSGQITVTES